MVKNFDRKFINEKSKNHRENFLVEQEKGLMVATQGHVDRLIVREEKDTITPSLRKTCCRIIALSW